MLRTFSDKLGCPHLIVLVGSIEQESNKMWQHQRSSRGSVTAERDNSDDFIGCQEVPSGPEDAGEAKDSSKFSVLTEFPASMLLLFDYRRRY